MTIDSDLGSSQWQQVDALASKFPDRQKAIDSINAQLQKKGLDWERDVKPALGPEMDVVMLDLAHPNETVGLLQPKDQGAFERLVKKGNTIDPSSKLLYHQFHGWTVVSDRKATIDAFEQASDSAKHTLSADKTFSSAMGRAGNGILRAYVNGPRVMAAARNVLGPDSASYFKKLGTLDWLLMSVRAKSDGIAWDTTVHGTPGKQGVTAHGSDGSLQKLVPKDALLYLAFHGARGMLSGLGANPVLQQSGFKGLGTALGRFDTILQGENALYVRPAGGHLPEVTFIAAPGHGVDGAAVFGRLVKGFSQGQGLHYANVNGRLVVSDLPSGIAFAKAGGKSLAESPEYQSAAKSSGLPTKPQVVLYVDIHSTIPVIQRSGQRQDSGRHRAEPEAAAFRGRVRREPLARAPGLVLLAHQVVGRSV